MTARTNHGRLSESTKRTGFVALVRSPETIELLRDPNAFALLALVALRARFSQSKSAGLQRGQMLLGRESAARELGIKQGATREATKRLISAGYIAVRTTSRGSIVTLLGSDVFDICEQSETASRATSNTTAEQPTDSQRTATNEEGRREEGKEQGEVLDFPPSLDTHGFRTAWDSWHAYRRERKLRQWTPATCSAKLAELASMGEAAAVAAIHASIGNGWQSIYPPKPGLSTKEKPATPHFR